MPNVPIKDIRVLEDRGRKDFSKIGELVESIGKFGLLHPVVLRPGEDGHEKPWELVAGERRLRACILLGWVEIPFTQVKDLDAMQIKEVELEENIQRKDLSWPERIELTRQIDETKRLLYGSAMRGDEKKEGWSQEKTAELTGESSMQVSRQIKLAKAMEERPDIAEQVRHLPMSAAIKTFARVLNEEEMQRKRGEGLLDLSNSLLHGSCLDLVKNVSTDSVDLIITDIPYGLTDIETHRTSTLDNQIYAKLLKDSDNLTEPEVVEIMTQLIPELARVLKPNAHMYMFFAMNLYPQLRSLLEKHFNVRTMPLIWNKGKTTAPGRGYDYSPCSETLFYCENKGPVEKRNRLAKDAREILDFKPATIAERRHPFQKPIELLEFLIKQSSITGDLVLDTFAGSGATLVAAHRCGRRSLGFEFDEGHYLLGQKWLIEEKGEG